ncbi:hypothetical protein ES705_48882 [subsurface metagenome]
MILNVTICLVTPPVGTVLFVGMAIGNISMNKIIKPLILFIIPLIIVLLIVTYVEPIAMFIPNMIFGE